MCYRQRRLVRGRDPDGNSDSRCVVLCQIGPGTRSAFRMEPRVLSLPVMERNDIACCHCAESLHFISRCDKGHHTISRVTDHDPESVSSNVKCTNACVRTTLVTGLRSCQQRSVRTYISHTRTHERHDDIGARVRETTMILGIGSLRSPITSVRCARHLLATTICQNGDERSEPSACPCELG